MSKLATVDPLPDRQWSAKGAAGDALERAPHKAPFVAIWQAEDGSWKWSKANTDFQSLAQMATILLEFAQSCVREAFK